MSRQNIFLFLFLVLVAVGTSFVFYRQKNEAVHIYRVPKETVQSAEILKVTMNGERGGNIDSELLWETPEGWKQDDVPGMMQLVSFSVLSLSDDTMADDTMMAKASIVIMGGQAGGIVANVNRWRRQINLSSLDEANILKQENEVDSALGSIKWFEITGSEKTILAGLIKNDMKTIFVKLIGDNKVVSANKDKFLELLLSIHYVDQQKK